MQFVSLVNSRVRHRHYLPYKEASTAKFMKATPPLEFLGGGKDSEISCSTDMQVAFLINQLN